MSLEQLIRELHFKLLIPLWKLERGVQAAAAGPQGMAGGGRHVERQPCPHHPPLLWGEPRPSARRGRAGWHPGGVPLPRQPPWLDTG